MKRNNQALITSFLDEIYPNVGCELIYHKSYELLIAVMLSAQTSDKAVNKVTAVLFSTYPTLESLANADVADVIKIIASIGLAKTKASNVINIAKTLITKYGGEVINDKEALMALPGIGNKTSEVVLLELYDANYFPVDTHVARISKRLGICKETDSVKTIEEKLYKYFTGYKYGKLHHQFIHFGRGICHAQNPQCEKCKLTEICKRK